MEEDRTINDLEIEVSENVLEVQIFMEKISFGNEGEIVTTENVLT